MVRRILLWVITVELVSALILVWMLAASDDVPDTLLRNGRSFSSTVNFNWRNQYSAAQESLESGAKYQRSDTVVMAYKLSIELNHSLDSCMKLLDNALVWYADVDRVIESVNQAFELTRASLGQFELIFLPYSEDGKFAEAFDKDLRENQEWIDRASTLPPTLLALYIERARVPILNLFFSMQSVLAQQADAAQVKFDNGIPPPPAWVKGMIAFNAPSRMRLGEKDRIQVRISRQLASKLSADLKTGGEVTLDTLTVSDIMMVKLDGGENFQIIPFDEEEQGVTDDGYTQWEFDISPKSAGDHDLYLKVGIIYYVPNLGPAKKFFPVYEKRIQVTVTMWQRIAGFTGDRWEFLLSSIVIPALVWTVSRLWRRRNNAISR